MHKWVSVVLVFGFLQGCSTVMPIEQAGIPAAVIHQPRALVAEYPQNLENISFAQRLELSSMLAYPATQLSAKKLLQYWPVSAQDQRYRLLQAKLAWLAKDYVRARAWLHTYAKVKTNTSDQFYHALSAEVSRNKVLKLRALDSMGEQVSSQEVWRFLYTTPISQLAQLQRSSRWASLAQVAKRSLLRPDDWLTGYRKWRKYTPELAAQWAEPTKSKVPAKVGVLLPLSGPDGEMGRQIQSGILAAYYQLGRHGVSGLHFYDTSQQTIAELVTRVTTDHIDALIGPLHKEKITTLAALSDLTVPVLALNKVAHPGALDYLDRSYTWEAVQAANRMMQDGRAKVLVIADNTEQSRQISAAFSKQWSSAGGDRLLIETLPSKGTLSSWVAQLLQTQQSAQHIHQLRQWLSRPVRAHVRSRQDIDGVFLALSYAKARQIVPLLRYHYYDKALYGVSILHSVAKQDGYQDLSGTVFCDAPWRVGPRKFVANTRLTQYWPTQLSQSNRAYALGIDALYLLLHKNRLQDFPMAYYPGATGNWYVVGHRFYPMLAWAQYHHGRVKALPAVSWLRQHALFHSV